MTPAQFDNMSKAMRLCAAYSCTMGGTGTLIGTPPTIVLKAQTDL